MRFLLSFFILTPHREGWCLSFTEGDPVTKSIQEAQGHHQSNGAAKNRFKQISMCALCKYQLILLLVLCRLNKKFNVQVTMQAKFVVSNIVTGSNYCFCGSKDFTFFFLLQLCEHLSLGNNAWYFSQCFLKIFSLRTDVKLLIFASCKTGKVCSFVQLNN